MKTQQIIVSAPGKIHLLGEHIVVYGFPALLTAVDKRCTVKLTPTKTSDSTITSTNLKRTIYVSLNEIIAKQKQAQEKWEAYRKNNDTAILKAITADEMDFALIAIGETFRYWQEKVSNGFRLEISSEIPIGAGLGSSAAIAVSIVAAITALLGKNILEQRTVINDIAFLVEQKKHGLPSGGDNATVCFGGLVWYRKETADLKTIQSVPFSIPQAIAQNFVIIDTGRPAESTGEMVSFVKGQIVDSKTQQKVEKVFIDQEKLVRELLSVIKNADEANLIRIIRAGERNLEQLGVVSPSSQKLIRKIEESGGAGKICGGGGITKATGVILAYHPQPIRLQEIAQKHQLAYYDAVLGGEGLREE